MTKDARELNPWYVAYARLEKAVQSPPCNYWCTSSTVTRHVIAEKKLASTHDDHLGFRYLPTSTLIRSTRISFAQPTHIIPDITEQ